MQSASSISRRASHLRESGSIGVVLSGEIYNFQELRNANGSRPPFVLAPFEVVAHSYEEWGLNASIICEGCLLSLSATGVNHQWK